MRGCIHSNKYYIHPSQKHDTSTHSSSFLKTTSCFPLLNWTFKTPRMSWIVREVLIGLHKSRCAHREPSVDTVIGKVVMQIAFKEFVNLKSSYVKDNELLFQKKKKLTVSSKRLVTNGVSCGVRVSPGRYIFSCEKKEKRKKQIKMVIKKRMSE